MPPAEAWMVWAARTGAGAEGPTLDDDTAFMRDTATGRATGCAARGTASASTSVRMVYGDQDRARMK
jgi:hypothetical protein